MFEKYQHFIGISMISFIARYKGIIEIPIEFWDFSKTYFSRKIFHLEKKISKFFWTPMSTQNLPRIPKIALRTACGEAKESKNTRSSFFFLNFQIQVYCYIYRPLSLLDSPTNSAWPSWMNTSGVLMLRNPPFIRNPPCLSPKNFRPQAEKILGI